MLYHQVDKTIFHNIFARFWILMVLGIVILTVGIDYDFLHISRLDYVKDPSNYIGRFLEGHAEYDETTFRNLSLYYREVIRYSKYKALAYGNLALCYFYLKDYDRALQNYEKAIQSQPDQYSFYFDAGLLHLVRRDNLAAADFFDKGLKFIGYERIKLYQLLGFVEKMGDKSAVLEVLAYLRRCEEDEMSLLDLLGHIYFLEGNFPKVMEIYEGAVQRFPQVARFHLQKGIVFVLLHNWDQANDSFRRAKEIDPSLKKNNYFQILVAKQMKQEDDQELLAVLPAILTEERQDLEGLSQTVKPHFFAEGWFWMAYNATGFQDDQE